MTRLNFSLLELNFEVLLLQFLIFSSFLVFEYELFPYSAQKIRLSCQKCFLRVQTNIWWKTGFGRKCVTLFWTSGKKCRILVEEYGKFVRAAVYPYGRSFWRWTNARKNLVFHLILGLRKGNFFDQAHPCLFTVDKTAFYNSGAPFWEFFPTISNFLIKFGFSVWTFSIFSSKVSAQSSKMHLTCTDENLTKNWVSTLKCYSFSKTFGLYTKNCRTFGEEIQHVRQSCLLLARRIILKKNNFSKEPSFSYVFETYGGN